MRAALVALLALRVLLAFTPGRALWGFDLARDLEPLSFWIPFGLTLAAFLPGVGDAFARLVSRRTAAVAAFAIALAGALTWFVWVHPDRALYNGDTSLRHGAFAETEHPEKFAEQSLRGDLVLHHAVPRALAAALKTDTETVNRLWGVLALLTSVLGAWLLAHTLGARGAGAVTAIVLALSTGALALFNGYGKSTVEIAVLTLFVAVGLVQACGSGAREARAQDGAAMRAGGALTAALAVAAALLLHRSALALVPARLAAVGLAASAVPYDARRRPLAIGLLVLALAAPLLAWSVVSRDLLRIMGSFDTAKHLHGGLGAAVAFAFTPRQLADVLNALGILLPVVPVIPVLLWLTPRASMREMVAWAAFVLPPLALLLLAAPQHGLPRDWDVFTLAGVALAALAAWRTVVLFEAHPRLGTLALPLLLVAFVPALQWVAIQRDAKRAWARAEAVLLGPPLRDATERAYGFDTIGLMCLGRGQAEMAARMFERSAEAAPNPSTFVRWGMALTMLGRPADAMPHYRHAATLDPNLPTAWRGIAAAASAIGDRPAMEQAVGELARLVPDDEVLRDARAWLEADNRARQAAGH